LEKNLKMPPKTSSGASKKTVEKAKAKVIEVSKKKNNYQFNDQIINLKKKNKLGQNFWFEE
jgi:hypothetical protein